MTETGTEFAILREKAGLTLEDAAALCEASDRSVRRWEKPGGKPPALALTTIRRAARARCPVPKGRKFQFIDLFAGIGGLRKPFEELGGQCVFTSEWDRYARETYAANYPETEHHVFAGDIRPFAAEPWRVPRHDVLLAGFPCQPFSIAGVSKKNSLGRPHGFLCDTQGTLFYDLAEIIRYQQPRAFLLENVKNLERHDGGRTFATIMHVLKEELGYHVQYKVISSEHWVPQKRERIFIVGFKEATTFSFDDVVIPEEGPKLGSILQKSVPDKYTLTKHLWKYLQDYKDKHAAAGNGFGYSLFGPNDVTRTLSARYYKDGSEILIEQKGKGPRRLTPLECARLMGFEKPDGDNFKIPVSDTQAYRQFGNAVVVPVVRAVAKAMAPHIIAAMQDEQSEPAQRELPLTARVG